MNNACNKCRKGLKIVLAGNPNVGKSTIFNHLTGLKQHTGNWPGKTVELSCGTARFRETSFQIIDTPGTYSLYSQSAEEDITADFLCFGDYDCVIAATDATCLERNLNLVLQICEITSRVVLCVNLMDQAEQKGIYIDKSALQSALGIPVVLTCAGKGRGMRELLQAAEQVCENSLSPPQTHYPPALEEELSRLESRLDIPPSSRLTPRFAALRLLEGGGIVRSLAVECGIHIDSFKQDINEARLRLKNAFSTDCLSEIIVASIIKRAEKVYSASVSGARGRESRDRRLDKVLTSKKFGIPIMLALLFFILWLSVVGANFPSRLLSAGLGTIEALVRQFLTQAGAPEFITGIVADGVLRTTFWVVSVMLPPMAIFFPLFTLLEDFGYLPRIAFMTDALFAKADTCGKQMLTTCMGLGCNAVGVSGCRIIKSKRERLIAMLTNSFIPCNGRFPAMIAVCTIFFTCGGFSGSLKSALCLLIIILAAVALTLMVSKLLSLTFLRGKASVFTLELPPYRRPDFLRVIARSFLDRTLFVLGRAVAVAAPSGAAIWLMANLDIGGFSPLELAANTLQPLGTLMGLDGHILLAFILGLPANEIVIPLLLMCYTGGNSLTDIGTAQLGKILMQNDWTALTAVCFLIFSLSHFPCSTTCLTIKKESGSIKWTALAVLLPLITGGTICALVTLVANIFS